MIFHSEAVVHYSPEKYNSKRISTLYNPRSNTAVYPLIFTIARCEYQVNHKWHL